MINGPAWILESRSASLHLPEDDEAVRHALPSPLVGEGIALVGSEASDKIRRRMRGVGRNEASARRHYSSSDLASLGHLLPQGEKKLASFLSASVPPFYPRPAGLLHNPPASVPGRGRWTGILQSKSTARR